MSESENDPMRGHRMAHRLMRMVGVLHERGYESLYLYSGMSGSGGSWRYAIGAMDDSVWPRFWRHALQVFNSMNGGEDPEQIAWAGLDDAPDVLADRFVATYPEIAEAARVPNPAHAAWYRNMLAQSEPVGALVFYFDYKLDPRPEFWATHEGVYLELPPGLDPDRWM